MKLKWMAGMATAAILSMTACKDDATNPEPDIPMLPPNASMQFDFSFFNGGAEPGRAGEDQTHWQAAAVTVWALNLFATSALVPPSVVLGLALDTTPSYLGDNAFMWIYTWTDGTDDVQVRLRGELIEAGGPDYVDWELRVTNTAEDQDNALWFTGESAINGRSGEWAFYDIEAGNETDEFVVVDWAVNDSGAIVDRDLSFTVMTGDDAGDQLAYNVLTPDVMVTVTDASESETAEISWDEMTGTGYIEAPEYNDGDRGCWDDSQINVTCPVDPAS